jgi:hypothetical protein
MAAEGNRHEPRRAQANMEVKPWLAALVRGDRDRGRQLMLALRNELYRLLCMASGAILFLMFVGIASNYLPGPDWLWYVVGFVGLFWMEFLIHEKFDSPSLRPRGIPLAAPLKNPKT